MYADDIDRFRAAIADLWPGRKLTAAESNLLGKTLAPVRLDLPAAMEALERARLESTRRTPPLAGIVKALREAAREAWVRERAEKQPGRSAGDKEHREKTAPSGFEMDLQSRWLKDPNDPLFSRLRDRHREQGTLTTARADWTRWFNTPGPFGAPR